MSLNTSFIFSSDDHEPSKHFGLIFLNWQQFQASSQQICEFLRVGLATFQSCIGIILEITFCSFHTLRCNQSEHFRTSLRISLNCLKTELSSYRIEKFRDPFPNVVLFFYSFLFCEDTANENIDTGMLYNFQKKRNSLHLPLYLNRFSICFILPALQQCLISLLFAVVVKFG